MWMYKVCKMHKKFKAYCVIARYADKREAENSAREFALFDHYEHRFFVKRYSEKEF